MVALLEAGRTVQSSDILRSRVRLVPGCAMLLLAAPVAAAATDDGGKAAEAATDAGAEPLIAPAVIVDLAGPPGGRRRRCRSLADHRCRGRGGRGPRVAQHGLAADGLGARCGGGLRFSPAMTAGQPVEVEIGFRYHFVRRRRRAATIRGDVLSRGNRRPIPGAEIEAGDLRAVTDEQGRFSLSLPPGPATITVRAAGFERRDYLETLAVKLEVVVRYRLTPSSATPFETIIRAESERTEVSRITLQGSEIHDVAGTFGDPLRVILLLPGVGSVLSGVAYPVVRGSDPADTGYYLDGISIPILFHLYLGPEVISPDFVDQVDFYPSNPPADEGRHLTGAVSVTSKQPREEGLHASVYVDALNAGGFAELAIPSTGTSVAAAGRISYSGLLAETIANALISAGSPQIVLNFSDYQARVDQVLGGGHLRLFVFGSNDTAGTAAVPATGGNNGTPANLATIDFVRADLRYQHPLWHGLGEIGFTYGNDDVGFSSDPQLALGVHQFRLRASWRGDSSPTLHWLVGMDGDFQHAELSSTAAGFIDQGFLGIGSADASFSGAWTELTWKPNARWSLTPAFRVDNYFRAPSIDDLALEPRFTARYQVHPELALTLGAGLAHQPPVLLVNLPAVDLGALGHGLQEGLQTEIGAEWTFLQGNRLNVTAYYNPLFRTVELGFPGGPIFNVGTSGTEQQALNPVTRGEAFGFELMLRHPLGGNWFGWLSYALSWSLRDQTFPLVDAQGNVVGMGSGYVPFAFDETHIANATLSYRFPHGWSAGFVLHFNSGRPEAGVLGSYTMVPGVGRNGQPAWIPVQLNKVDRLPPFFRLDLRVAKTFTFDQVSLELYFDFLNATISWETLGYQYSTNGNPESPGSSFLTKTPISIPIVVPMLGLRATYWTPAGTREVLCDPGRGRSAEVHDRRSTMHALIGTTKVLR